MSSETELLREAREALIRANDVNLALQRQIDDVADMESSTGENLRRIDEMLSSQNKREEHIHELEQDRNQLRGWIQILLSVLDKGSRI
ncbi:MAG: hypothetical protein V3T08_02370 [Gemmatimonadota bacterium]